MNAILKRIVLWLIAIVVFLVGLALAVGTAFGGCVMTWLAYTGQVEAEIKFFGLAILAISCFIWYCLLDYCGLFQFISTVYNRYRYYNRVREQRDKFESLADRWTQCSADWETVAADYKKLASKYKGLYEKTLAQRDEALADSDQWRFLAEQWEWFANVDEE
jgi:hypothetical protein